MSAAIYFQQKTGTNYPFVPYRGTGPAIQDLIAGQIDIMVDQSSNSLPHVQNGKLRAFAVTASKRLPSAPDIPSVDEAGLPGSISRSGTGSGCRTARRTT